MVNKNLEDFYYQAFVKWIFSLTDEEKVHILSFWSEYDDLEDTLNELKKQLSAFYQYSPFQYEMVYEKKVKDPVKHTFDKLQSVFSSISGKKPLKNPTIEKSMQRILANAQNGRYKMVMLRLVDYQAFDSEDPVLMLWLQSMMEVQRIPYDFILNEKLDFYSLEDLCEDLATQNRLTQLEKEAKGSIEKHPRFAEIYEENKTKNFLKQMSVDVVCSLDSEFLVEILSETPANDYPKIVELIFTKIESALFMAATMLTIDEEIVMNYVFNYMNDYLEKLAKNANLLLNYKKINKEMTTSERCITFARAIQTEERFQEFIDEFHSTISSAIFVELEEANNLDFDEEFGEDQFSKYQLMVDLVMEQVMTQILSEVVLELLDDDTIDVELIFAD